MATYDYLRKQALLDVWRIPSLDRQFIVEPQRVTKSYGRRGYVTVMWDTMALPDQDSYWHVYDGSSVPAHALNLFTRCQGWTPLSDSTNKRAVYINAYVDSGIELPRFDSYYRYTESGVLVFAFKINKKLIPNLDKQSVFIRVYSGAANSPNFQPRNFIPSGLRIALQAYDDGGGTVNPPIEGLNLATGGRYIKTPQDIAEFAAEFNALPHGGMLNLYHNGIWYAKLSDITIKMGDWLEWIYDKSKIEEHEFAVKDLFHYNSDMDADQKYLLHIPGTDKKIRFYDDIDFYVYNKLNDQPHRGIYFHKNKPSSVRQLTHRDLGLRTRNLSPIATILNNLEDPHVDVNTDRLYIKMFVRDSALRPNELVFEHTRLFELYKMSEFDILRAMQGIDSNIPFWKCENLEKSWYTYGMGCKYNDLTKEVAENIYGYNAAAKIVGDTPVKITPGVVQDVKLPIRMQHGCTMYEYDADGLMIGWYQHLAGATYRPRNLETVYLEGIVGLGSTRLDQLHNVREVKLNEVFTYRVYNGSIIGNAVQNTFEDVTGSDKYEIVDGKFKWLSPRVADYPIVMSDAKFFAQDYLVKPKFGTITINLATQQNRPTGDGYYTMPFPMGQMDVFIERHSGMEKLDYFIDFPRVHIVNKSFLNDPMNKEQRIHIRICGFATKDFQMTGDGDVGFVEHGYLSNNNRFDLRDDKVQRVVVGGRLYTKSELEFSEEHSGVGVTHQDNGKPYMVKDMLVPVKPYTVKDMYELRDKSKAVDKIVSEYLTLKLPQPDRGPVMAVLNKHVVFSPFINRIITDVRSGVIGLPMKPNGFERQDVVDICKKYEYLLKFDPIREPHLQDMRFVTIQPHGYPNALGISANGYRFVQKVVDIYCDGLVTLSPHLKTA